MSWVSTKSPAQSSKQAINSAGKEPEWSNSDRTGFNTSKFHTVSCSIRFHQIRIRIAPGLCSRAQRFGSENLWSCPVWCAAAMVWRWMAADLQNTRSMRQTSWKHHHLLHRAGPFWKSYMWELYGKHEMQDAMQRIKVLRTLQHIRSNSRSSDTAQLHDQSRKFVEQVAAMTWKRLETLKATHTQRMSSSPNVKATAAEHPTRCSRLECSMTSSQRGPSSSDGCNRFLPSNRNGGFKLQYLSAVPLASASLSWNDASPQLQLSTRISKTPKDSLRCCTLCNFHDLPAAKNFRSTWSSLDVSCSPLTMQPQTPQAQGQGYCQLPMPTQLVRPPTQRHDECNPDKTMPTPSHSDLAFLIALSLSLTLLPRNWWIMSKREPQCNCLCLGSGCLPQKLSSPL